MTAPTPWYIDPDTGHLTGGPKSVLTGAEWREQVWPSCPVCGATIRVDRVEVTRFPPPHGGVREYIVGMWECPNECDPRRADPRTPQ